MYIFFYINNKQNLTCTALCKDCSEHHDCKYRRHLKENKKFEVTIKSMNWIKTGNVYPHRDGSYLLTMTNILLGEGP